MWDASVTQGGLTWLPFFTSNQHWSTLSRIVFQECQLIFFPLQSLGRTAWPAHAWDAILTWHLLHSHNLCIFPIIHGQVMKLPFPVLLPGSLKVHHSSTLPFPGLWENRTLSSRLLLRHGLGTVSGWEPVKAAESQVKFIIT